MPIRTVLTEGRIMMTLGFVIAATATIRLGGVYIQRLCISNFGDISDVGLFVAGSAIATQYIDVILGSMSSDYTPRLASVSSNLDVFIQTINRQIRLMLIIILPAIVLFLIFSKQLIIILYSSEFLSIVGMIKYMMLAMFFRTISWCISFSFVALGESKTFFWNETLSTIYSLAFSVIGFVFWGFEGLGLAFLATYLCYTFQMYFLAQKKFSFVFERDCLILIIRQFVLLVFSFLLLEIFKDSYYSIVSSLLVLCIVISITYKEFNKVVSVNLLIRTLKNKLKKW